MTRDQAHRIPPLPSNVRDPFPPPAGLTPDGWDWDRTDPGYDQPGPPRRSDISWQLVIEAVVVFLAIGLCVFLASLVEVGS